MNYQGRDEDRQKRLANMSGLVVLAFVAGVVSGICFLVQVLIGG